ncbi:MAG TPA: hypothetical protein PK184_20615 [Phycisphaerae bacterium]|nr:hypothetical protein [Phycisphaerae bacterium]HPP29234.1 hypothetical protein [Phycisphaerae bacterium]HPU35105.1 hypothetical protein [Phycisphaerae bacterium]
MRIIDRSLPYPVLSPTRDDVMPNRFDLHCNCRSDSQRYYISYEFEHEHPGLADLVRSETAAYAVHVEGRDNFYRILHVPCRPKDIIEIEADHVSGTVEITGFVVARQPIHSYTIQGAHPDYGNATFSIRPGDVLAYSRTFTFEAEKEYDPLRKLSSIMQLLHDDRPDGPFVVDLDQEKITVFLSKPDYESYGHARHDRRLASLLIQGIVLPVLVTAIADAGRRLQNNEPLPKWAQIVRQRLEALQMSLETGAERGLEYAQAILQHPTRRFLTDLLRVSEGERNEPEVSE